MKKNILNNAFHLYLMTAVKVILPIAIMPYLARVLSTEQYAVYSFVRACVTFVNLIMDYGFIYSATKEISKKFKNKKVHEDIIAEVTGAKLILLAITAILFAFVLVSSKQTQNYLHFSFITLLSAGLLNLLPDYLFRGIEQMSILSSRFIITRIVFVSLLFLFVKNDEDFLCIAYFELIASVLSLLLTIHNLKRKGYRLSIRITLRSCIQRLKEGLYYFITTAAPSIYGALNTIFIANVLNSLEVVYWSNAWNVVSAGLSLINPIVHSIFPYVVKEKKYKVVKHLLIIGVPVLSITMLLISNFSELIIFILAGKEYVEGSFALELLLPVIVFAYCGMLLGSPVLGAIGHEKEMGIATVIGAVFHVVGLALLYATDNVLLQSICILRCTTEFVCTILRLWYVYRYRNLLIKKEK